MARIAFERHRVFFFLYFFLNHLNVHSILFILFSQNEFYLVVGDIYLCNTKYNNTFLHQLLFHIDLNSLLLLLFEFVKLTRSTRIYTKDLFCSCSSVFL